MFRKFFSALSLTGLAIAFLAPAAVMAESNDWADANMSTVGVYSCFCGGNCIEYPYPTDATPGCEAGCEKGPVLEPCPQPEVDKCKQGNCIKLDNPLSIGDDNISVPVILGNIIKGFLGVIGSLALLMLVWGGFQWLTSMGNAEKVQSGSKTMLWAAVGIVLVFASYILVSTIFSLMIPPQPAPAEPLAGNGVRLTAGLF